MLAHRVVRAACLAPHAPEPSVYRAGSFGLAQTVQQRPAGQQASAYEIHRGLAGQVDGQRVVGPALIAKDELVGEEGGPADDGRDDATVGIDFVPATVS